MHPWTVDLMDSEVEEVSWHSPEAAAATFKIVLTVHVTDWYEDDNPQEARIDVRAEVVVVEGQTVNTVISSVAPDDGPILPDWIGDGNHPQILRVAAKDAQDHWEKAADDAVAWEEGKWERQS